MKAIIESGEVEHIVIFADAAWTVYLYDADYAQLGKSEHETLEQAYQAIRTAGWQQMIQIDG